MPDKNSNLPALVENQNEGKSDFATERDIMYKVLFDMRKDINDLKKLTLDLMQNGNSEKVKEENSQLIDRIYEDKKTLESNVEVLKITEHSNQNNYDFIETVEEQENLSLQEKEVEMIKKSLEKNNGKRKLAAQELGISERTLYRKIKQYEL